jgi:hypothetical protein
MTILAVGRQLFGAEYFWRVKAGERGRANIGPIKGHSDFAGLASGGTAVYVEAKSVGSPGFEAGQKEFLDNMERRGAFCCVAFDEVPGQVARAWAHFCDLDHGFLGNWLANYEANLAEAKRVGRLSKPK